MGILVLTFTTFSKRIVVRIIVLGYWDRGLLRGSCDHVLSIELDSDVWSCAKGVLRETNWETPALRHSNGDIHWRPHLRGLESLVALGMTSGRTGGGMDAISVHVDCQRLLDN